MRVCTLALSQGTCKYNHLWAVGTPYAIHSHPYGTTTDVRAGSLDRVLPSWPGSVHFGPSASREVVQAFVEITGDGPMQEVGPLDCAAANPLAFEEAMDYYRKYRLERGSWDHDLPSWDDVMAGGSMSRCAAESASHRCDLSRGHDGAHHSQVGDLYYYRWAGAHT